MITNEEVRKAIDKYQKEHPLYFRTMIDVTALSSKEGVDIISQTIDKISKKIDQDTDLWCICEMAKMYMQGVKPVYPIRPQGEWIMHIDETFPNESTQECNVCHAEQTICGNDDNFCPNCGAKMKGGAV